MTEVNQKYLSESTLRALRIMHELIGHETRGLKPGEIAKKLDVSPSNVTRALHNLLEERFIEEHPKLKGHWRMSISDYIRTSNTVARGVDNCAADLHDVKRFQVQN